MKRSGWNDRRIEEVIGKLLRAGVTISAGVVLFGSVMYLAHYGGTHVDYRSFHGEKAELRTLSGIVSGAGQFSARAIIQLGLVLLIATPVARVVFSAVAFAVEGDRMYVFLTLVVLAILLYSLFGPVLANGL